MLLLVDQVVRTKIVPPRRRVGLLHRPRLVDFMHENLNRKVLLLSAAPGYGKTSLLVDFLQEAALRFSWYSMDEADADPWTFVSHLAASVMEAFPEIREHLHASLSGTGAQDFNAADGAADPGQRDPGQYSGILPTGDRRFTVHRSLRGCAHAGQLAARPPAGQLLPDPGLAHDARAALPEVGRQAGDRRARRTGHGVHPR